MDLLKSSANTTSCCAASLLPGSTAGRLASVRFGVSEGCVFVALCRLCKMVLDGLTPWVRSHH